MRGADDRFGFQRLAISHNARDAPTPLYEAADRAALADIDAQLAAFPRQSRDIVIRFAVAAQGIEKPDRVIVRLQQGPALANLRGVEDFVGHPAVVVQRQEPLAPMPFAWRKQIQAAHGLKCVPVCA